MTLFYSSPPVAQTVATRNPALLVSWWCTLFSLVIILLRLAGRYIRTEKLFREDKIMAIGIIPLMVRMAFTHVVLRDGTNNAILTGMTQEELDARRQGAMLVLPARLFYTLFLWVCKLTISEFLKRLNFGQAWKRSYQHGIMAVRYGLAASFIAIIIATFTECMPTSNYWQVTPDPGPKCRQAFAQLIVLTFLDIFTDLALVVFPMTIVIASKMPKMRKLSLCALFSLSVVPVGIALYRIDGTIKKHGQQEFRSLLASIEILAATSVANAVVLGSFVRDRGVKKQRWKLPSTSATSTLDRPSIAKARRPRPTVHSWGSDYDLVGDLGLRLGPEFSKRRSTVVRPAPVVLPLTSPSSNDQSVSNWPLVGRNDSVSTDNEDAKNARLTEEMPDSPSMSRPVSLIDVGGLLPPDISSPRSMNFFDVGGLLEENLAAGNPGFRPLVPPKDGQSSRSHSPFRPLQSLFVPGQGEPAPSFHSASTQSARAPGGGIAHIISDAGRLPGPQHSPARHVRIDNDDDDDQPISPLGTETESRGRSRYER